MNKTRKTEKTAGVSGSEREKYIKAAILSGIASAGIGAFIRNSKRNDEKKKSMDAASSNNAIVIQIKKKKFMEGLPTPNELAESRGEGVSAEQPAAALPEPTATPALEAPKAADAVLASADDIEARKKAILKGRKFDFFGKRASDEGNGGDEEPKHENSEPVSQNEPLKIVKKEKIEGHTVLRDMQGKFVSPTDPVAVQQVEKQALSGLLDPFIHPVDTLKEVWDSATGKPLMITGGAVGSLYLASKISDAINRKRREKAKKELEASRDEYVGLLEGDNEKSASGDDDSLANYSGKALGAALFVPMALTAIVTNKIIENRKAESKKLKETSDTYPDEPVILYKTSEDKEIEIGADTALMAIMVKRAMIIDAEKAESMEKTAQSGGYVPSYRYPVVGADGTRQEPKPSPVRYTNEQIEDAVNNAVAMLQSGKYNKQALDLVKAYEAGDQEGIDKAIKSTMSFWERLGNAVMPGDRTAIYKTPEFRAAMAKSKRVQDVFIDNFENDEDWKAYKNQAIDDKIKGWGFNKNGFLYNIISWLAKNTGIGNMMFNRNLRAKFEEMQKLPGEENKEQALAQNGANATGGSEGQAKQVPAPQAVQPAQQAGQVSPTVMDLAKNFAPSAVSLIPGVGPIPGALANIGWHMFGNNAANPAPAAPSPAVNAPAAASATPAPAPKPVQTPTENKNKAAS